MSQDWLFNAQIRGAGRACWKHWEIIEKWFSLLAWLMCSKHLFLESEKWFCRTQTRQTGRHGIEYYIWNLFFKSVWLTKRGEKHNFQYLLRGEKDKTSVQRRKFPSWFLSKETIIWRSLLSSSWWSVLVCSCQYEECIDFSQKRAGKGILRTVLHKSLIFLTKHLNTAEWGM